MATLLGNSSIASGPADNTGSGYAIAQQFACTTSGSVTGIAFYETTQADSGVTSMVLGIWSDNGSNAPGTLLGSSSYTGRPPADTWLTASGLSVAVVASTLYWLAFLPLGGSGSDLAFFNDGVSSGGSNVIAASGSESSMSAVTWTPTLYAIGPLSIYATGTSSGGGSSTVTGGLSVGRGRVFSATQTAVSNAHAALAAGHGIALAPALLSVSTGFGAPQLAAGRSHGFAPTLVATSTVAGAVAVGRGKGVGGVAVSATAIPGGSALGRGRVFAPTLTMRMVLPATLAVGRGRVTGGAPAGTTSLTVAVVAGHGRANGATTTTASVLTAALTIGRSHARPASQAAHTTLNASVAVGRARALTAIPTVAVSITSSIATGRGQALPANQTTGSTFHAALATGRARMFTPAANSVTGLHAAAAIGRAAVLPPGSNSTVATATIRIEQNGVWTDTRLYLPGTGEWTDTFTAIG